MGRPMGEDEGGHGPDSLKGLNIFWGGKYNTGDDTNTQVSREGSLYDCPGADLFVVLGISTSLLGERETNMRLNFK